MEKMGNKGIGCGIVIGSFISIILLDIFVVYDTVIPDPCKYHNEKIETNWLFDLFYSVNAGNNWHPEATIFHMIFTPVLGIIVGVLLVKFLVKER
ncbi:MAG: hypothetical protein JXR58_07970 [Bacteroidales bacterium]|nr:hypothetical protein [Bacteroidales bacterium]